MTAYGADQGTGPRADADQRAEGSAPGRRRVPPRRGRRVHPGGHHEFRPADLRRSPLRGASCSASSRSRSCTTSCTCCSASPGSPSPGGLRCSHVPGVRRRDLPGPVRLRSDRRPGEGGQLRSGQLRRQLAASGPRSRMIAPRDGVDPPSDGRHGRYGHRSPVTGRLRRQGPGRCIRPGSSSSGADAIHRSGPDEVHRRLLARLADDPRSVLLVTHATELLDPRWRVVRVEATSPGADRQSGRRPWSLREPDPDGGSHSRSRTPGVVRVVQQQERPPHRDRRACAGHPGPPVAGPARSRARL